MRYALLILFFISGLTSKATHVIGGNFQVTALGGNDFEVKLTIFKDCNPGTASLNDIRIFIYDAVTFNEVSQIALPTPMGDTLQLGDQCYSPPSLCVEEYTFIDTITLVDNPNGYILSTQTCCRNHIIDNIVDPGNTGMTWSIDVADPALQNNTPDLGPYPKEGFLCLNVERYMDLSAIDPDGDSLHYRLVTPYTSPQNGVSPPPFSPVSWKVGYSVNNAIPGNPPLEINPVTGMLKCNASQLGVYVFAYSISEYRDGVKIGESRRDMQLQVLPDCQVNHLPEFVLPEQTEFTLSATEEMCFPVLVVDSNTTDSIFLRSYFTTDGDILEEEPNTLGKSGIGEVSGKVCYTASCVDVGSASYVNLHLMAFSFNCEFADTIQKTVSVSLNPLPKDTEGFFPNVFTPNGDGANDYFTITKPETLPCLEDMEIRIFNRWGMMVYHNSGSQFGWDGTYDGADVSEGVYFFTVEGKYAQQSFFYKNFLTLFR